MANTGSPDPSRAECTAKGPLEAISSTVWNRPKVSMGWRMLGATNAPTRVFGRPQTRHRETNRR